MHLLHTIIRGRTLSGLLRSGRSGLALAALAACAVTSHASSIYYTYTGVFSGSLGGTSFADTSATFVFSKTDTRDVTTPDNAYFFNTTGVGTFQLGSGAAVTFTGTNFGVESEYGAASFQDLDSNFTVGVYNELTPYDVLSTAGAPVIGDFVSYGATAEQTSGGALIITGASGNVTFQAITPAAIPTSSTPEPASLLLVATGLLGAATAARRKARRA